MDLCPETGGQLGTEVSVPQMTNGCTPKHGLNNAGTLKQYDCHSNSIPYLDALLSALEGKFGEQKTSPFALLLFYPKVLKELSEEDFKLRNTCISKISVKKYFHLVNFECEAELWRRS